MSDAPQPAADPAPPAPQTLSEFQQQFAAQVLANMRAASDATLAAAREQQAKLEAQTVELLQALKLPMPPGAASGQQTGGTGQAATGADAAAPAGPT